MTGLPFTVTIPGAVTGKGRPRFVRATGRTYTPAQTLSAENRIAHEVTLAWRQPPLDEALMMTLEIRVAIPKSKPKKFREAALASGIFPTSKPDCSNVLKLVEDSLNGVLYRDDSCITRLFVSRRYAADPGITLTVSKA